MTQRKWWLAIPALLLVVGAGPARAQAPAAGCGHSASMPELSQSPCCCPGILSNIPYLGRLFKNCYYAPCETAVPARCAADAPRPGCCCEKEKGDCPCKKPRAETAKPCPCPISECCPAPVCKPACPTMEPLPPPMAFAPCGPASMACPPPGMMPMYPPVAYYAPPPPPPPPATLVGKRYVAEVKVVDTLPGADDQVLAAPKLMIVEGCFGHVAFESPPAPATCAEDGAPAALPTDSAAHLMIRPAKAGWVYLDLAVEQIDRERTGKKGKGLVEYASAIHVLRKVKLGKTVKVPWKEGPDDQEPTGRIEVKVKEVPSKTPSVVYDAPPMPYATEACPVTASEALPPPRPVTQASYSMPAACPINNYSARKTIQVVVGAEDQLEIVGTGDTHTCCKKMEMKVAGCGTLKLVAAGEKVALRGDCFKASADCITACEDGNVTLEGHVRLWSNRAGCCSEVRGDKVRVFLKDGKIKLDLDTYPACN